MKAFKRKCTAFSTSWGPGCWPAQDKEFVDKYKAAWEKGDKATLESFLYTKDANPMALEFYKMMQTEGAGTGKITKIELVDLTPEDAKKASEVMTGPDGIEEKGFPTVMVLDPAGKVIREISGYDGETPAAFIAWIEGKSKP